MNKMKIAMLGSFPPLRGISSYCYELANSLAKSCCYVYFISFKAMYPRFLYPGRNLRNDNSYPKATQEHLQIHRNITWYNPISWFTSGFNPQTSLLHAQWWSLPLAPIYFTVCLIYRLRKKPIVFTVHNVLSHEKSRVFFLVSHFLLRFGNHFIVHSKSNRQQLIDFYDKSPREISLIPHGPLNLQLNGAADRKKIRAEMGLKSKHRMILLFGAIRPYKGVMTAIEAFKEIIRKVPNARLLIAGKLWENWEPYHVKMKEFGIEKSIIAHLDYIPSSDVHRFFLAADLVILPYQHFYSQSGVGGTAVAFRKPLIVSCVGGLPDLVLDETAVIEPNNPSALSSAIIECLENPKRLLKMAKDAEDVAQMISWSHIACKTEAVYSKLIRRQKK